MIKANELSDKQKAMAKQRTKDYIKNDLEHALIEIEKELVLRITTESQSTYTYFSFGWLSLYTRTNTDAKRRELCLTLDKYGYRCDIEDGDFFLKIDWST